MRHMRKFKVFLSLLFVGVSLPACVTQVKLYDPLIYKPIRADGIKVTYGDVSEINPVNGEKIKVAIREIRDKRPNISCLGAKPSSFDGVLFILFPISYLFMETGKVDVENGVIFLDLFKKHLINAFELVGFEIVPIASSDLTSMTEKESIKAFIEAEVKTFWVEFIKGFAVVGAESEVLFEITLTEPNTNRIIWSDIFKGGNKVSSKLALRNEAFEQSINSAYAEAMKNFYRAISDDNFKNMLR